MGMRIGELARVTGAQVETIRYYERTGLLPAPPRTEGNYRIYGDQHVARLSFILHCRALGMALDDIRQLLGFKDAPQESCGNVNRLLDDHIIQVRERIRALHGLEAVLQQLREQCPDARTAEDCGILKELSEPLERYAFAVPEAVRRDALRPLRNLAEE
jgi:Cd(II)/Pb(II)-responsive transcriptional regulator